MKIQYISTRPIHVDGLHGTGEWLVGDIKEVDEETARRLLRHVDVFAAGDVKAKVTGVVEAPAVKETNEADKMQETYDLIATMQKDALRSFIKSQFNRNVDMRQHKDIGTLRNLAIQLTDQYGVLQ